MTEETPPSYPVFRGSRTPLATACALSGATLPKAALEPQPKGRHVYQHENFSANCKVGSALRREDPTREGADKETNGPPVVAGRFRNGTLEDASGWCPVVPPPGVADGDWISGRLLPPLDGTRWRLKEPVVHAPGRSSDSEPAAGLDALRSTLQQRSRIINRIRSFFEDLGFLHVETPCIVSTPAVEEHLEAVTADDDFLATSPELHLKRLLAAGYEKIYEITPAFRAEERGRLHRREFTILEWYRAWSGLDTLKHDCEELVTALCTLIGRPAPARPFKTVSYRELFKRLTDIDPARAASPDGAAYVRAAARRIGLSTADNEGIEEILERVFVHAVEPRLRDEGAVFLEDFPAWSSALARIRDSEDYPTAVRFELYLDGI